MNQQTLTNQSPPSGFVQTYLKWWLIPGFANALLLTTLLSPYFGTHTISAGLAAMAVGLVLPIWMFNPLVIIGFLIFEIHADSAKQVGQNQFQYASTKSASIVVPRPEYSPIDEFGYQWLAGALLMLLLALLAR